MSKKKIQGKRLLRYWGCEAQQHILILVTIVAVITLCRFVFAATVNAEEVVKEIPMFIIFMGIFVSAFCTVLDMKNGTSLSMSFGSTRREAFLGQQFSQFLRTVEIIALYSIFEVIAILYIGSAYSFHGKEMLCYAGVIITVAGIVQLISSIAIRIGGKALTVMYALCGAAGGAIGGGLVSYFSEGIGQISISGNLVIPIAFTVGGLVIYSLCACVNYRNIRRYAVV